MTCVSFRIPDLRIVSESNARNGTIRARQVAWARRREQKRIAAEWTATEMAAQSWSRRPPPPWAVKLIRVAPRRLDDGNLEAALKWVQDGVAAGLGVDDREIKWSYAQRREAARQYGVLVAITAAETEL